MSERRPPLPAVFVFLKFLVMGFHLERNIQYASRWVFTGYKIRAKEAEIQPLSSKMPEW